MRVSSCSPIRGGAMVVMATRRVMVTHIAVDINEGGIDVV